MLLLGFWRRNFTRVACQTNQNAVLKMTSTGENRTTGEKMSCPVTTTSVESITNDIVRRISIMVKKTRTSFPRSLDVFTPFSRAGLIKVWMTLRTSQATGAITSSRTSQGPWRSSPEENVNGYYSYEI